MIIAIIIVTLASVVGLIVSILYDSPVAYNGFAVIIIIGTILIFLANWVFVRRERLPQSPEEEEREEAAATAAAWRPGRAVPAARAKPRRPDLPPDEDIDWEALASADIPELRSEDERRS
ncbi:MAG: hypothetical protein HYV63_33635 [Candidatus Schekmanbacteria bacterium]|nr:hypothetical protein [Candidatus Schekmanbacteria bacterium]